jgi:Protein of unknown function (DUF3300)
MRLKRAMFAFVVLVVSVSSVRAQPPQGAPLPRPQEPPPNAPMAPPPVYPAQELERIVSPIALYPDPLLAQVLAAATYSADIPEAARWADQHHYLTDAAMTNAMAADRLPWDPAVQALLPFPSVLGMMASNMPWTEELGAAFLAQQAQVMDAVQQMRQRAYSYGYLRSNARVIVRNGPFIEVVPAAPEFVVVPYYDPLIVFAPPRRGFLVAGAIGFGYGVRIGPMFSTWGWGATRIGWNERVVVVNNAPWRREWANRATYAHPYAVRREVIERRAPESHRAIERTPAEREAERRGRGGKEEHKKQKERKKEDDRRR